MRKIRKLTVFLSIVLVFLGTFVAYQIWRYDPFIEVRLGLSPSPFPFWNRPYRSLEQLTPEEKTALTNTYFSRLSSLLHFGPFETAARNYAIRQIGRLKDPSAIQRLMKWSKNDHFACSVFQALADIGDVEVLPFLRKNAEQDIPQSACAKAALARFRLQELEPLYLAMARAPHEEDSYNSTWLREAAAYALGGTGTPAAIEMLLFLLESDPADSVRRQAARSLSELNVTSALDLLFLKLQKADEPNFIVDYLHSISEFNDADSLVKLEDSLEILLPLRWHRDERVRQAATQLTDRFRNEGNRSLFEAPPAAVQMIARQEQEQIDLWMETLSNKTLEPYVRREAAENLSVRGVDEAVPIFIEYSRSKNVDDRRTGYFALARFDDISLLEIFQRGEKDNDSFIRRFSKQIRRQKFGLTDDESLEALDLLLESIAHPEISRVSHGSWGLPDRLLDLSRAGSWLTIEKQLKRLEKKKDMEGAQRVLSLVFSEIPRQREQINEAAYLKTMGKVLTSDFFVKHTDIPSFVERVDDPRLTAFLFFHRDAYKPAKESVVNPSEVDIPKLIHLTGAGEVEIRILAETLLKEQHQDAVLRSAIDILMDSHSNDRFLAARLLSSVGPSVMDMLLPIQDKLDEVGQSYLVWILNELEQSVSPEPSVMPHFKKA